MPCTIAKLRAIGSYSLGVPLRSLVFGALLAITLPAPYSAPVEAAPARQVTSLVIDGQGSGHGRGLSAWGAYGSAVNRGWSWQQILDHYYGGTTWGNRGNEWLGVRLTALDASPVTAVLSTSGQVIWNGGAYGSVHAWEVADNRYDVYTSATADCPGSTAGTWTYAGQVIGPVSFGTPYDWTTTAPGDVLGVCQPNGLVIHYRGFIQAVNDTAGANRTVNVVDVESYVRGVLPREVFPSWGSAGGGAGMNALRAFAVAARTFGLSQSRYPYARTCDTPSCQVYGGAAVRQSAFAIAGVREHPLTDRAAAETAGVVRVWPGGGIVSAEYSASHGPRSAGGPFPAVDDTASNVPQNPSYQWTRTLDVAAVAARYGLGTLTAAWTEPTPGSPYDGVWANRVRLQGTAGEVVVSNWDFRNAFGLPSPGFTIRSASAGQPPLGPRPAVGPPSLPCLHKRC